VARSRVTIDDIAHTAGVSDATVSLSFQPDSRISPQTRRRVLAVARRRNYVPNLAARALRYGVTKSIGILVTELTNPWYAVLIRHAEEAARERGYQLVIAESQWSADKELAAISSMAQMRVQGLLFCCSETNSECFDILDGFSLPCVLLDSQPRGYRGSSVGCDLVAAGRIAAGHLAECGCRSLAFLTGSRDDARFSSFRALLAGFGSTARRKGLAWSRERCVCAGLTVEEGGHGMVELLSTVRDVDGVFCVNDLCAMGAMEALEAGGRRPGVDVAVMGVDDNVASGLSRISLTSIRFPYRDLARSGTDALVDLIEGRQKGVVRQSVPPELVVRNTTRSFGRKGGNP
jgi:LacI family transcriptional regulator